jgi:Tfp pilus assembly protein PilO
VSSAVPLRYYFRHPAARGALWTLAALAVLAIVLVAVWLPGDRSRRGIEREIERRRADIVRMREQQEVAFAYEKARGGVELLEQKLAYAATQAQQVTDISQLARKHGVSLLTQAYEESARRNEPPRLYTEIAVQGSYRSLESFIADLPQLPSWTESQDLVIERSREGRAVKGRIRLVTYRGAQAAQQEAK